MKPSMQIVEEVNYGVYVWQFPDGAYAADSEHRFLCVDSMRGDREKMRLLQQAVKYNFGTDEGEAVFFSGQRQVSDDEYEYQQERMASGLTPDPYDLPALIDEAKARKQWKK